MQSKMLFYMNGTSMITPAKDISLFKISIDKWQYMTSAAVTWGDIVASNFFRGEVHAIFQCPTWFGSRHIKSLLCWTYWALVWARKIITETRWTPEQGKLPRPLFAPKLNFRKTNNWSFHSLKSCRPDDTFNCVIDSSNCLHGIKPLLEPIRMHSHISYGDMYITHRWLS